VVEVGVSEHDRVEGRGAGTERLGHLRYGTSPSAPGLSPQSIRTRVSGVERMKAARPTSQPSERGDPDPFVVGHLLAVDLSADAFENVSALLAFVLQEAAHVRDGGGFDRGRPNDLGVQPTFWVISRSVEPRRPITMPGFSASMTTSPVSSWKSRSVTPASSGITDRTSSSARAGGAGRSGPGGS